MDGRFMLGIVLLGSNTENLKFRLKFEVVFVEKTLAPTSWVTSVQKPKPTKTQLE